MGTVGCCRIVRKTYHGDSIMICFHVSAATGDISIVFYCCFVELCYILFICTDSHSYDVMLRNFKYIR